MSNQRSRAIMGRKPPSESTRIVHSFICKELAVYPEVKPGLTALYRSSPAPFRPIFTQPHVAGLRNSCSARQLEGSKPQFLVGRESYALGSTLFRNLRSLSRLERSVRTESKPRCRPAFRYINAHRLLCRISNNSPKRVSDLASKKNRSMD